jgi:hypothetical protein
LLSEKLESQSKVVEASLSASQAVFEQTKIRTTEIINAAERGRSRITWVMSTLTAGFTLLLAFFSFLGYDKLNTAEEKLDEIEQVSQSIKLMEIEIEVSKKEVEAALASVSGLSASVATVKGKTEELDDAINESVKAKGILFETLIPIFMLQVEEQINQKRQSDTGLFGRQILESNDDVVTIKLLKKIYIKIKDSHQVLVSEKSESDKEEELSRNRISFYTIFIYTYIYDDKEGQTENSLAMFLSSYILLATYAMNEDYARVNDFYHGLDSTRYPTDGIDNRLNALISSDNDAEVKNMFKLDSKFVEDLKGIEWAKAAYSADRKNRVEKIWAKGS